MSASIQDVGFNYLSQMMELLLEAQNDPVFSDLIFILLSGAMVIAPLILITAADFIVRRFLLKPRIIVRKEPRGAQVNNEKISSLQANVVSLASSNECNAAELIEFKENMEVFLLESEVLKRLTSESEAENRRLEELHSRDANTITRLQNELNKSSEDLFEYSEKVVSLESAYVALKGQLDSQSSRYHVDKESLKDGYQLDHEKEGRPSSVESLKSEEIIKEFERKELILQETLASTSDMLESSVSRVADLSEHLIVLSKSLEEARALHQKEVETLTTKIRRQEDLLLRLTSVSQERNVDYKSNNVASLGKFVADTSEIGFNESAPVKVEGYVMRRFQEENIVEEEGRETEGESKNLKLYVAYLQQELDEALESKKELMAKKASLETALRNTSLSSRDMTENHSALKGKGLEATLTADEALKTELREARASLEAIVLRAQQSEKLLDEHQTTIAALEMKLQLKSAALEESKNQMAMSEEEFAQLRRELNSSYERLTALRGQMIRHTIAHKSSERESRAKLYLMTEEKDAQIAKLHGLSAELERLRTRVVEQEDRHEVALKSVEQQLDIPKEEQSIAGESSQTEACLDTELSQKSADNEEKRTMRRSHERDLLALQRSSESEIADLREQICVLKEECCTLKASIFGLKDERDVLQRQLLDAEALREQLAGAETSALSSKICSAGETSAEFANAEVDAKTDALPSLGEQLAAEVSAGKTEDKLVALQQTNAKLMAEKREKELQLTLLMKELESNRRFETFLQFIIYFQTLHLLLVQVREDSSG